MQGIHTDLLTQRPLQPFPKGRRQDQAGEAGGQNHRHKPGGRTFCKPDERVMPPRQRSRHQRQTKRHPRHHRLFGTDQNAEEPR